MISARPFLAFLAFTLGAAQGSLSAAIKTEPIPPLRPPGGSLEEPMEVRAHWPWFVAAGCLAVSAILLWPRKQRIVFRAAPASIARRALTELRKPDAVALGQILRNYIIATHAVPGPGQTFEQLAAVLEADNRWTPALRERFRRLADPLEIAKFAPGATVTDLEQLHEEALGLVEQSDALQRPPIPASP
jgi:hypothetical protein